MNLGANIKKVRFQLTTSRRGRRKRAIVFWELMYFNSRPHEEVDISFRTRLPKKGVISTHDLTKRSTDQATLVYDGFYISTHDLTKRSTCTPSLWSAGFSFQLTTSRRGRLGQEQPTVLARIFQLTTSRRGRLQGF